MPDIHTSHPMQAFNDELDWYIEHMELPIGIARTKALKENLFTTIVCTVTHTPLIIVGAPGSSKTLSFNLAISNLKGEESKKEHFRNTDFFKSLDPHFYQCSHRTTSNEIQKVFSRAINRQRSHINFKLPVCCVVFMDEAGLPEESLESLKVLHYHLDRQEVSFVAITNHILDAAKTNRAVCLFRPDASEEELKTLVKGCLCTTPNNPPPDLQKDLNIVVQFCPVYFNLMTRQEFSQFFGLRDFIHFVNYLRRHRAEMLSPQLVMKALERNFSGSDNFETICRMFLSKVNCYFFGKSNSEGKCSVRSHFHVTFSQFQSSMDQVQCRGTLEVLQESLEDCPQQQGWDMAETEVRYKMIIDPSEDDSLVRLLFTFGVLQRKGKHMNGKVLLPTCIGNICQCFKLNTPIINLDLYSLALLRLYIFVGRRLARIVLPFCFLIAAVQQPGNSIPPSQLKHSLDVYGLLHQQFLSTGIVQL